MVVHGRRAHELALILEEPLGEILVVVSGVLVVRVVDDSILYMGKQSEKKKRQSRIRNGVKVSRACVERVKRVKRESDGRPGLSNHFASEKLDSDDAD